MRTKTRMMGIMILIIGVDDKMCVSCVYVYYDDRVDDEEEIIQINNIEDYKYGCL